MRRQFLNLSSSWLLGCAIRGKFLRMIGFPLPLDGKISCHTRLGGINIKIGADFAANERCWIDDNVEIGDHVRFGHGVKLTTCTHPVGPGHKRRGEKDICLPIVIEDGVWIWPDARIQPGVRVARGCIISTASVVIEDTEPNGFYAGNPARRVAELDDHGNFIKLRSAGPARRIDDVKPIPPADYVTSIAA